MTVPKTEGASRHQNDESTHPRHPVIFSAKDWGVQSPPQHRIEVPLPFSEGDWIPMDRE